MNAQQVSLTFISNEVVFSNVEVNFIRKHLHWKYPAAMGGVIEATRTLMRDVQKLTRANQALTYTAARFHPDNTTRFVVYEILGSQIPQGHRSLIAVQPVEKERKTLFFDKHSVVDGGINTVIESLETALKTRAFSKSVTSGGIKGHLLMQSLIGYLKMIADEVIVKDCMLDTQADLSSGDVWSFNIDLAHRGSQSHYIRLGFDFFAQIKPQSHATQNSSDNPS